MCTRSFLSQGMRLLGVSGTRYQLKKPCVVCYDGLPPSIWLAFDIDHPKDHFTIKQPWDLSHFRVRLLKNETLLGQEFRNFLYIRRQLDTVPEVVSREDGSMIEPPRLALEYMQRSVRQARWQRTFTRKEIKWIMRWTLYSLIRIEAESLVNTGNLDLHYLHNFVLTPSQISALRTCC